jgi:hypothetical protein
MVREPLDRINFDAAKLMEAHPPQWQHPNKQAVFDLISSANCPFEGQIVYARWPVSLLPPAVKERNQVQIYPGVFTYAGPGESSAVEWHMNFADPDLFVAYGSPLLAQDELQVAEHPILGSLREALDEMDKPAETVDAQYRPTPITITGVQRRCAIDTLPDPEVGRPHGLYGNAFARASVSEVTAATRPISPPTISNILAIAALDPGDGDYEYDEIAYIATAAYTGFLAARWESVAIARSPGKTRIHTGFWGCGAFGGNRILMTILQALAADLAEVDLAFHAFDDAGVHTAEEAYQRYARMADLTSSVDQILHELAKEKFPWGESDGN